VGIAYRGATLGEGEEEQIKAKSEREFEYDSSGGSDRPISVEFTLLPWKYAEQKEDEARYARWPQAVRKFMLRRYATADGRYDYRIKLPEAEVK
jgi:hypothetical protein